MRLQVHEKHVILYFRCLSLPTSVSNFNSTFLSFLVRLVLLILLLKESERDQIHISCYNYFESFRIQMLTVMYCLEHTDHDIHLHLLFQILHKLVLHASSLYLYIFYIQVAVKFLFLWE